MDGKKRVLACKFFLWVVRHFRGALLICFVARKCGDGHKVLKKLCSTFLGRSARGKTTAGKKEVNQRKQLLVTAARKKRSRGHVLIVLIIVYVLTYLVRFLIHTGCHLVNSVVSSNSNSSSSSNNSNSNNSDSAVIVIVIAVIVLYL